MRQHHKTSARGERGITRRERTHSRCSGQATLVVFSSLVRRGLSSQRLSPLSTVWHRNAVSLVPSLDGLRGRGRVNLQLLCDFVNEEFLIPQRHRRLDQLVVQRARVRERSASARLLVSRSVFVFGVCSAHISRELAGHRDLSAGGADQALSRGHSWSRFAKHVGRCQSDSRLVDLCRLCTSADQTRARCTLTTRWRSRWNRPSMSWTRPRSNCV